MTFDKITHFTNIYVSGVDLLRFKDIADLIVAHDTEPNLYGFYHYNNELNKFAASVTFTHPKYPIQTTVVSNVNKDLVREVQQLARWANLRVNCTTGVQTAYKSHKV